ncbi:glycosyltransferase family 2 protein [Haliscomenobacter sp.]|uniref:glycosyltransferase family 2 protein n=1 Tax=Haliscomenobacter sp. TaxID=2717303 RepID=UPI003BA95E2C
MIQILVPLAGSSSFFQEEEFQYPKPLIEIKGIPMIQWVIECLQKIEGAKKFIFILNERDCTKFHLDDTISILTDNQAIIVKLKNATKGAICSALMAIDELDTESPLLISNGDQVIEKELQDAVTYFDTSLLDAGVVTFQSVHPKWSFIRTEGNNVVETAEKRPISRDAVAGIYYFKKTSYFIKAAFDALYKDSSHEGFFFISAAVNELILTNQQVGYYKIENKNYHSFYSPQKIKEFESQKTLKN